MCVCFSIGGSEALPRARRPCSLYAYSVCRRLVGRTAVCLVVATTGRTRRVCVCECVSPEYRGEARSAWRGETMLTNKNPAVNHAHTKGPFVFADRGIGRPIARPPPLPSHGHAPSSVCSHCRQEIEQEIFRKPRLRRAAVLRVSKVISCKLALELAEGHPHLVSHDDPKTSCDGTQQSDARDSVALEEACPKGWSSRI